MPEYSSPNPDLNIIIHLDESEDTSDGMLNIGKGETLENTQVFNSVQGNFFELASSKVIK